MHGSTSSNSPAAVGQPAPILRLEAYRRPRRRWRLRIKLLTAGALCVLGLIGSFADTILARTSLFFIGAPGALDGTGLHSIATAVLCATIANLAACGGVLVLLYFLLARPSATVVPFEARRRKR